MFKNNLYKDALKKFAGDYIYSSVEKDGTDFLTLKGGVKNLGILMVKIDGWQKFLMSYKPKQIVSFLNDYFPLIFDCIHHNNGIINNIINDQIIVSYGLNKDTLDNKTLFAAKTAKECCRKFNELISKYEKLDNMRLIAGISEGDVLLGNFGSSDRLFNVVMGDYVNLANILMNMNNNYNTNILATEAVITKLKDSIKSREIDSIKYPKSKNPLKIFEIIS